MKRIPIILALALFVALACAGDISARNTPWGYVPPANYSGSDSDDHTWGGEVNIGDDGFTHPAPASTTSISFIGRRMLSFDLVLRWLESFHANPFACDANVDVRKEQVDSQRPIPNETSHKQGN